MAPGREWAACGRAVACKRAVTHISARQGTLDGMTLIPTSARDPRLGRRGTLVALFVLGAWLAAGCGGGSKDLAERVGDVATPGTESASGKSWAGKDPAPAFPSGLEWFNVSTAPRLQDLKGKVVLLDFWTLGCINCQHIVPDLKQLEAEFPEALVVIGVHSGKYATEHDGESIREASRRLGLTHAVVNDPDFDFWNAYGANAWPTVVVIDPAGNLVGGHSGEGVYALFHPIIQSLAKEFDAKGQISRVPFVTTSDANVASTVLSYPGKVLADEAGGRLFIADSGHNRILVAGLDGSLRQAIGSGSEGFADGGPGEASFRQPQGLALSADGKTLFVADTRNHAVRAVALATGEVTTIAGTGKQLDRLPLSGAKGGTTALGSPWDVVAVGETLFIAMAGVHQIWALDLKTGMISVFAGTSREGIQDGARRTVATLAQPSGITTDGTNLIWVDPESSSVRFVPIAGEGQVRTLVGTGLFDYGDEDGIGKKAKLQHAQGIVFAAGGLFLADTYNHKVKTIAPLNGATRTLAGDGRGRADGGADEAQFDEPGGLGYAAGTLYVADTNNHSVRTVNVLTGTVATLALSNLGVAAGGLAKNATKLVLPAVRVAPGIGTVRLTLRSPAEHHLNSQAPGQLTFTVSDPKVIALGEKSLTWSSDSAEISLPLPVELQAGTATLTATGFIYYCRTGAEALCFIHQVELSLPIIVDPASTASEAQLAYTLPTSTS